MSIRPPGGIVTGVVFFSLTYQVQQLDLQPACKVDTPTSHTCQNPHVIVTPTHQRSSAVPLLEDYNKIHNTNDGNLDNAPDTIIILKIYKIQLGASLSQNGYSIKYKRLRFQMLKVPESLSGLVPMFRKITNTVGKHFL